MMAILAGKLEARRAACAPFAVKSTPNRQELSLPEHRATIRSLIPGGERDAVRRLLQDAHVKAPAQISLNEDAKDDPLHGQQEGRLSHGDNDWYGYLPLYVFCGCQLLAAKLRDRNRWGCWCDGGSRSITGRIRGR